MDVMWTDNDQCIESIERETIRDRNKGTTNDNKRPLDLSRPEVSKSYLCPELAQTSEKRLKSENACQVHQKKIKETDKLIRNTIYKWQMRNFTKCIYDNAVNLVLDSISTTADSVERQNSLNATSYNFTLENEAVLMAIEWKGLKQQNSKCSCSERNEVSENTTSFFSSKSNNYFHCSELHHCSERETASNSYQSSDNNTELNFENSFITTAVSAAIEQKGLSMYPV